MPIGSGNAAKILTKAAVDPMPVDPLAKVGIDDGARSGKLPLNGLRHPPAEGTSGWYIWGGEESSHDDDFFKPLHARHLTGECPAVLPYLALPPGWRFLIAEDYEDIWFDQTLLTVG